MNYLEFYRKEKRISQQTLASVTHVPRWKIQMCEQQLRCLNQIERERIASALQVGIENIFPALDSLGGGSNE